MGHERTVKQVDDELDDLCLQMVQLMDDYCSCISRLEHCLRDGCVHLAKSRYLLGNHNVSSLQLPTSSPYTARLKVICEEESDSTYLEVNEDGDDPIKRFGVLVPGSLRTAQKGFYRCLESTIEAKTIKSKIEKIQGNYLKLKDVRKQLIKA